MLGAGNEEDAVLSSCGRRTLCVCLHLIIHETWPHCVQLSLGGANWQILDPGSKIIKTFRWKILKLIQNVEMNLIEHRRFCDSISACTVLSLLYPCVICYASLALRILEFKWRKAKDILAFPVLGKAAKFLGHFPKL